MIKYILVFNIKEGNLYFFKIQKLILFLDKPSSIAGVFKLLITHARAYRIRVTHICIHISKYSIQ